MQTGEGAIRVLTNKSYGFPDVRACVLASIRGVNCPGQDKAVPFGREFGGRVQRISIDSWGVLAVLALLNMANHGLQITLPSWKDSRNFDYFLERLTTFYVIRNV